MLLSEPTPATQTYSVIFGICFSSVTCGSVITIKSIFFLYKNASVSALHPLRPRTLAWPNLILVWKTGASMSSSSFMYYGALLKKSNRLVCWRNSFPYFPSRLFRLCYYLLKSLKAARVIAFWAIECLNCFALSLLLSVNPFRKSSGSPKSCNHQPDPV